MIDRVSLGYVFLNDRSAGTNCFSGAQRQPDLLVQRRAVSARDARGAPIRGRHTDTWRFLLLPSPESHTLLHHDCSGSSSAVRCADSPLRFMETDSARPVVVMLPPKNCLPRNYSCIAGLFGSLAAANPRLEDEENYDIMNGTCEPVDSPVVEERPRSREVFLKPPTSPNLRRRCKSLPTPSERGKLELCRSRSPTSQKKVRFADSLGLELISVKHFDDTDEPEVPQRILAKLPKGPMHLNHLDTKFPRAPTQSVFMELQFTNPGTLPGFEQKVREVRVMLESVQADEFSLSGFVRVLNLAFEKSVSLRYSLNNWITFMDSLASYVPNSSDGVTDKFCFKIVMPTFLDSGGTLQFAIKYCVDGHEFWDNNQGHNYKVRRHRLKMSPPREWENGWIHFI
ncbi:protein phosphatase 1 regulatory subunit 3E [Thalassophryne amazonica]|uniref:protein phosphatase 1 regulatory subunit 3E n=1 Tax=Thalassophryne amazonica TaxID=390379 RepID=UPI001470F620|nr:protein phosphatase 1 regulatory subunit 3E [Thalassophryne amazonica]